MHADIELLVFGPHPDDLEIGLGGTIAKHAARGHGRSLFHTAAIGIPNHVAASRLLTRAAFLGGLSRYAAGGEKWRADWLLYYFINDSTRPSFVVDVSAHYETKRAALACHRSQFAPPSTGAAATRLNTPNFQQLIESRDAQYGALIGVPFAEGVVVRELLVREDLLK